LFVYCHSLDEWRSSFTMFFSHHNPHPDGPIIAIATSSGDVSVYALADMRRLYHISNVTALLMPHELMSCPDFTGHVVISITPAYAPVPTPPSETSSSTLSLLLLGLSCGIVVVVDAGWSTGSRHHRLRHHCHQPHCTSHPLNPTSTEPHIH
jgi:hypothetical protein